MSDQPISKLEAAYREHQRMRDIVEGEMSEYTKRGQLAQYQNMPSWGEYEKALATLRSLQTPTQYSHER